MSPPSLTEPQAVSDRCASPAGPSPPPPDPLRPALATAVRLDEDRLAAACDLDEVARRLGVAPTVVAVAGTATRIPVAGVRSVRPLPAAARRALESAGAWVAVRPAGDAGGAGAAVAGPGLALAPALPAAADGDLAPFAPLLARLRAGLPVDARASRLLDEALAVWMRPGFDALVSLPRLRFRPYPHQIQAAEAVLRRMRGRAILADEVGLGKTIEAGLVLTELWLRRLVARCLILVPAGLVEQWAEELDRKFALPVAVQGGAPPARAEQPWGAGPGIFLGSLAALRRAPHAAQAAAAPWDLVIVDEAHRLKNPQSAFARLVRALRARYLLLLTATPVENRLDDLFHLAQLVRPGYLGTAPEFRRRHGGAAREGVRDAGGLQARMRGIMVRHRRSEVEVMLPRRLAETVRVIPDPAEEALYRAVSAEVRRAGAGAPPAERLALRALQRLAGSSPRALAAGLAKSGREGLASAAGALADTQKARTLVRLLRRHLERGEKVAVFTGFRETLAFLAERLRVEGLAAAVYHGGLARREKDAVIEAFCGDRPVLLTTEAAGEGRNLQFCHVLVNFDLPWNPMQIEQRLGRFHRIGQTEDVLVTNLLSRGTVEEQIFGVLESKIHLFELVVGELDMILGRVEDEFDFESFVFEAYLASADDAEFLGRMQELGERLARARSSYLDDRARNDALLPEEARR